MAVASDLGPFPPALIASIDIDHSTSSGWPTPTAGPASWARIDVLILDDLGLRPLTAAQAGDLLEVIEDRHQRRSTILTSQLPISKAHMFG